MMFQLVSEDCRSVVGTVITDPICGADFCDECGCCPQAIVYQDDLIGWMDDHGYLENPFF